MSEEAQPPFADMVAAMDQAERGLVDLARMIGGFWRELRRNGVGRKAADEIVLRIVSTWLPPQQDE